MFKILTITIKAFIFNENSTNWLLHPPQVSPGPSRATNKHIYYSIQVLMHEVGM